MSPAQYRAKPEKAKDRHNVYTAKNSKWTEKVQDDVDVRSGCTSTTTTGSWPGSDDDRRHDGRKRGQHLMDVMLKKDGTLPPPPPPLNPPPKTKLTSGASLFIPKADLKTMSQAAPFVPHGVADVPSPWTPPDGRPCGGKAGGGWTPPDGRPCGGVGGPKPSGNDMAPAASGKDVLKDVIQTTLGSELWDLSMVDCECVTGSWYTNVDVVIPAFSASMCHLATSTDVDAIATAQLATQAMALKCVCDALQSLGSKVTAVPSEDSPLISVQYCAADQDMLCWEFAHHGRCPRRSSCKWAHAMVETFLINILLQPLTNWGFDEFGSPEMEATTPAIAEVSAPAPIQQTQPGLQLTDISAQHKPMMYGLVCDPDDTPWPSPIIKDISFNVNEKPQVKIESKDVTPTLRSKNPSRRMWADIQEDSDEDSFLLPRWNSEPQRLGSQECQ